MSRSPPFLEAAVWRLLFADSFRLVNGNYAENGDITVCYRHQVVVGHSGYFLLEYCAA